MVIAVHAQSLSSYVDPFIGTQGMGHTFPGACVPHGMVQVSPDTDTIPHNVNGVYQPDVYKYCSGYQYTDSTIVGFSHTHFNGTGHSDLGDILLMPTIGEIHLQPGERDNHKNGYRSNFSHKSEEATPGYYSVFLDKYRIKAELTATERVGIHQYTYPKEETEGHVIIDLNHGIYNYEGKTLWAGIRVENDTLVTGFKMSNGWARFNQIYFAISFSKPISNYGGKDLSSQNLYKGFWRKFDMEHNFPEMEGRQQKAYFTFDVSDGEPLVVKVALSAVDKNGAVKNLITEASDKNFSELLTEAQNKWEKSLSIIKIEADDATMGSFYTSLYHTMINPSVYMDVDGRYRGVDHGVHEAKGFTNYTIFSLWDTFRALHPLFNLIEPKKSADMLQSMLAHAGQSAHHVLPVWSHMGNENWCMIGYHGVSLLADAAIKGVKLDSKQALDAMINSSNLSYYDGTNSYINKGYVPCEENASSASISLEYAYDDWTIYRFALQTGNYDVAKKYKERACSYKNSFHPEDGYVHPRCKDGSWQKNFDIFNTHGQGFIEGNSLNYSFFVPHDVKGLIESMGGEDIFLKRLDNLFQQELDPKYYSQTEDVTREGILGSYVHGNEPSHHIPYLYMWTSEPWKTSSQVREVLLEMYKNRRDGLCGNDDCGQMSAWYIFSSLGFYPVCPGSDQYIIGSPLVRNAQLTLGDNVLNICVDNQSAKNCYIQKILLNGKLYRKPYFSHKDLIAGGELRFVMSSRPNKQWFDAEEKPYSLSDQDDFRIIPAVEMQQMGEGTLLLDKGVNIQSDNELQGEASLLKKYLANDFKVISSMQGVQIDLSLDSRIKSEEAYQLIVSDQISIRAKTAAGIFYGIQSLRQLVRINEKLSIPFLPKLKIEDKPAYSWRAFMLDESRAFKGKEVVMELLDEMARIKMNVFHWHLTDDQGWRIEIKKYPKLCQIGSIRDSTQIGGWRGTTYDGIPHKGYYTQDEIKQIITYAAQRHIRVIPEIEMPGHSMAAIASYPCLGTTKEQIKVACKFGVQYDVLDVSSPQVLTFLGDVLDEVISIFPDPVIHIGGDEVKYNQWKESKSVRSYMDSLNIKTPADLQIYFINNISDQIKKKGKVMMGWNDITGNRIHEYHTDSDANAVSSKLAKGTIVQFWKGDLNLIKQTIEQGYDIVNSYHWMTYVDYDRYRIPLPKAYSFDPCPIELNAKQKKHVLGLGCQMWGEEIMDNNRMYHMIFPRIAAYAECGWTSSDRKDYGAFLKSLERLSSFYSRYQHGER